LLYNWVHISGAVGQRIVSHQQWADSPTALKKALSSRNEQERVGVCVVIGLSIDRQASVTMQKRIQKTKKELRCKEREEKQGANNESHP